MRRLAARRHVRLRSFTEFQGMLDLGDYVNGQTARLRADPGYPPHLYVPQRYRDLRSDDHGVRDDLAAGLMDILAADEGRFVLVLGDFGRGKSFVLREVARRLGETGSSTIPILIDLGAMDRSHSVDGLVAAHLAQHGEDRIDLRAFRYMLEEGRIVLLFDGFDELVTRLSYDRAADHLEKLLEAVQGRAKVVVAARTQHFRTDEQVFTALGRHVALIPHQRVLAVQDFTAAQIRAYFVNRHGADQEAADTRFRLLAGINDLLELAPEPPDARLRGRPGHGAGRGRRRAPAHDQPGRAVPGDPRLLDGPREPAGVGRPGRGARSRHHGAVGRGHHARDGAVGEPTRRGCGPHSSSRSPTRSPVSPPRRSRSNNACTPSAAGACWCAPRRGCSGSSTRR